MRRGRFELADGGSIFLDEVGDLHEASQAKLLRVLQDGEVQRLGGEQPIRVSVRVISATNRHLDALIADGQFRQDLYYRLSVVPIRVPPLRERSRGHPRAGRLFLAEFCAPQQLPSEGIRRRRAAVLERYDWPGNVRELKNAVERMAILSPGDRDRPRRRAARNPYAAGARGPRGCRTSRGSAERERIRRRSTDRLERVGCGAIARHRAHRLHKRIRALGLTRDK